VCALGWGQSSRSKILISTRCRLRSRNEVCTHMIRSSSPDATLAIVFDPRDDELGRGIHDILQLRRGYTSSFQLAMCGHL